MVNIVYIGSSCGHDQVPGAGVNLLNSYEVFVSGWLEKAGPIAYGGDAVSFGRCAKSGILSVTFQVLGNAN